MKKIFSLLLCLDLLVFFPAYGVIANVVSPPPGGSATIIVDPALQQYDYQLQQRLYMQQQTQLLQAAHQRDLDAQAKQKAEVAFQQQVKIKQQDCAKADLSKADYQTRSLCQAVQWNSQYGTGFTDSQRQALTPQPNP